MEARVTEKVVMRLTDLVKSAGGGLWQQKVRTVLTLTGVSVGACSLAFSLSLGVGLRAMIDREFKTRPGFWEIEVVPPHNRTPTLAADTTPAPGELSPDRAARLQKTLAERAAMRDVPQEPTPITPAVVARMAALPDVAEVVTARQNFGFAYRGDRSTDAQIVAGPCDLTILRDRLVAGRLPANSAAPEAAVSELTLYDLGVRDEAGFAAVLGTPLKIDFGGDALGGRQRSFAYTLTGVGQFDLSPGELTTAGKFLADLPRLIDQSALTANEKASLKVLLTGQRKSDGSRKKKRWAAEGTFTIVGVLRVQTDEELRSRDWIYRAGSVFVPGPAFEPIVRQLPGYEDGRFDRVSVKVTPGGDLPAVVKEIEAMGFHTYSSVEWFSAAKREVTMIAAGLNVFALVSLLVASIGITNTLVTSVVERTREIGILKALGARDGQVMWLFLLEGTLIGLLGGLFGLGLARLLAGPADGLVKRLVQEQSRNEKLLTETIFEFPLWLSAGTVLFAVGVTTLAAFYPARRAARVQPVEALRHE
jgi:putative ABC transport system permease protein